MTDREFLDLIGDDLEAMLKYAKALVKLNKDYIRIGEEVIEWIKENPNSTAEDLAIIERTITRRYFSRTVPKIRRHLKRKSAKAHRYFH